MRMKKRMLAALGLVAGLTAVTVFPAFAEWKYDEGVGKWWWQEYDGTYPKSEAEDAGTTSAKSCYLDGNGDGIAELYYFDENGYLYTNTTLQSKYQEDYSVSVDENGAAYVENGILTIKVLGNQLPAALNHSFVNQTYINLMGRERSYIESVLGTAVSIDTWGLGRPLYEYAGDVEIVFEADRASYMMLPAKTLFNFAQDSYVNRDIASMFNIPTGYFGIGEGILEDTYYWYLMEDGLDQYVTISEGSILKEQDYTLYPDDSVSVGLYYSEE